MDLRGEDDPGQGNGVQVVIGWAGWGVVHGCTRLG